MDETWNSSERSHKVLQTQIWLESTDGIAALKVEVSVILSISP